MDDFNIDRLKGIVEVKELLRFVDRRAIVSIGSSAIKDGLSVLHLDTCSPKQTDIIKAYLSEFSGIPFEELADNNFYNAYVKNKDKIDGVIKNYKASLYLRHLDLFSCTTDGEFVDELERIINQSNVDVVIINFNELETEERVSNICGMIKKRSNRSIISQAGLDCRFF